MGTSKEYFDRYQYRRDKGLSFASGQRFDDLFDAVIGADVAEELGSALGNPMIVAHGIGRAGFVEHDEDPADAVLRELQEETGLSDVFMERGDDFDFLANGAQLVRFSLDLDSGEARTAPIAGAIADRFGTARVLAASRRICVVF